MRTTRTRIRRGLALALLVMTLGLVAAAATIDRWLFVALDPGAFDPSETPAAPDYDQPASWAALPELTDGADVSLADSPALDQENAPAAVFFVHPTTSISARWNAPIDDPEVIRATTRGATLIQASAFNACCAVYAPRYRQAHGLAFTRPDAASERARAVAFEDVSRAFDAFLERVGDAPFFVAGHSQGAVLAARLVRERIAGQALARRLVAAYLPGAPLREGSVGLPVCERPASTGCVISWNARGPAYRPGPLEFADARQDAMAGLLCVNPITWRADDHHAPAADNAGALFFDTETPTIKPGFADARCHEGKLLVTQLGDLERDLMSRALLWITGPENYHPVEYQLFYMDIRRNAITRLGAYVH